MDQLIIRPSVKEDLSNIMKLWNTGEVMRFVGYPEGFSISLKELEEWLPHVSLPGTRQHYSIYLSENYCGETFYSIDPEHNDGAIDIKLMPDARGQGVATRALSFAITNAFEDGGAKVVYVDPHRENAKALALYTRLGFVEKPYPKHIESSESNVYMELSPLAWRERRYLLS